MPARRMPASRAPARRVPASLRGLALLAALVCGLFGLFGLSSPARAAVLQAEREALQAYQQARQALAAAQWDEAELLLERVLMLMPENAEARLDFALLLSRRGQPEAARALVLGLAQDPRTSAAYALQLRALAARLTAGLADALGEHPGENRSAGPAGPGLTARAGARNGPSSPSSPHPAPPPPLGLWRAEATLAASTNPQSRTAAQDVVLTLPDGPVTLPLTTRPQPATVAGLNLLRLQGGSGLDVSVQQMDRPDTATAYRAAAWGPWPARLWPALAWRSGLGAPQWQLQTLRGFDNLRRHGAAVAVPLQPAAAPAGAQRLVLGAYAEPTQEDRGWLLRAEHRASAPGLTTQGPLQWQASLERSASSTRAQGYWRLNLALEAPLGPGRRLQAQASAQEDTHPYSPLLENNARRRLLTTYLGVEQQVPLGSGHALVLRAFTTQRASNLSLFAFRDTGAQVALVRQW
ncbi:MAG: tetratricopeptide repeat protein [Rubrivivax sp.]